MPLTPPSSVETERLAEGIPTYLQETYDWAYLNPRWVSHLDHPWVVNAILWGNASRLMNWAVDEFRPGEQVMQAACVYGDFSPRLARRVGPEGRLHIVDVASLQLARVARKVAAMPWVTSQQADLAGYQGTQRHDAVCCFFLLHELPADVRQYVVSRLFDCVGPAGRVVFVDYHRPVRWHPLRPVMAWVFRHLEPYAPSLLATDIAGMPGADRFAWRKELCFGGLYQKLVGRRLRP